MAAFALIGATIIMPNPSNAFDEHCEWRATTLPTNAQKGGCNAS